MGNMKMDQKEIKTLQLLEILEQHQTKSQRDLSLTLNMSLGLVNSFIKRLYNKGYFKIKNLPRNRVKYILTPKGVAEKSRLTYKYIRYSFEFYSKARNKLRTLFRALEDRGIKKIVFYGASDLAEIAYLYLQETSIQFAGLIDDDQEGKCFFGININSLDELNELNFDAILITELANKYGAKDGLLNHGAHAEQLIEIS